MLKINSYHAVKLLFLFFFFHQVIGQQYDLVVNGWELGGGSIRIHDPMLQEHVFNNILKTDTASFSHLTKGLWSGCPPHGGIALGKTITNSSV